MKRLNQMPEQLEDLYELVKHRFGVFRHILETGQFKPIAVWKSPKLAQSVRLETTADLKEYYSLAERESLTPNLEILVRRIEQADSQN